MENPSVLDEVKADSAETFSLGKQKKKKSRRRRVENRKLLLTGILNHCQHWIQLTSCHLLLLLSAVIFFLQNYEH